MKMVIPEGKIGYGDVESHAQMAGDLATKHSDCSSASYGGSLGEFGKGVMVKPFEDVSFSLKVGEFSEPFESDFGFHIAKRDK